MKNYMNVGKTQKSTEMPSSIAKHQTRNGGASIIVDNRPQAIAQRKLQEIANKNIGTGRILTSHVLQGRFDDQDINKMKEVVTGDQTLTDILNEVFTIHDQMPDDIQYGVSSKGGHAALNEDGLGQVVVKDQRWALTKKIKNLFNAYGMEHDIERQSMIIHELTHLAELYSNLPSDDRGVVPVDYRPKDDKALAEAMEPDSQLVDAIYKQEKDVYKLLNESDYDEKLKDYLRSRLMYGFAINAENPTVFTEISYYLKAKGKNGTPFYEKIAGFAKQFYENRLARKAQFS